MANHLHELLNHIRHSLGIFCPHNLVSFAILLTALAFAIVIFGRDISPRRWPEVLREHFSAPEYESTDKGKPLNEQTAIVEMGGRTFEIPKVFIQSNLGGKRVQDDGINLVYVMPDFTSRADFKNKAEYKNAFDDRRMAHMLVQPTATKISPWEELKNSEHAGHKGIYEGNNYGLEKYRAIRPDEVEGWHPPFDDYVEKNEHGEVVSYVTCSLAGKVKSPGCSHRFVDKGLVYAISFNKEKYLPTWREHRRKAIEFIDSFEVTPSFTSKETTGQ